MGLVLTRRVDGCFTLTLKDDADHQLLLEQLREGIHITLRKASGSQAMIEIDAPGALIISRDELIQS